MKENPSKRNLRKTVKQPKERSDKRATAQKVEPGKKEIGGTGGPEPTRYGDWEHKGIASDF